MVVITKLLSAENVQHVNVNPEYIARDNSGRHAYFIVRDNLNIECYLTPVAQKIWLLFSYMVIVSLGSSFETIAKCWLSNEKGLRVANMDKSEVL